MADFDENSLKKLEKLCRIECKEEEKETLIKSMKRILEYVDQLNEVDTENVPPCTYVLKEMQSNNFRKDIVGKTLPREEFLANTDHIGGMVRVPSVFETK